MSLAAVHAGGVSLIKLVVRNAFLSTVCVGVCVAADSAVTFQFQITPVHMYTIGPGLFYAVSFPKK